MALYSVDQIINRTLIAKEPVKIKRLPFDSEPTVYTVQPGATVGTVYSYLLPMAGRSNLYWMFYDEFNRPYYAEHKEGRYSLTALQAQGAKTDLEIEQDKARANETLGQKLERYANYILLGAGTLIGLGIFLKNKKY